MLRKIKTDWSVPAVPGPLQMPFKPPRARFPGLDRIDPGSFPDFLDRIGLIGMGGGGFPASTKIRNAQGKVHTLVVNAVECEPGISIDKAVLLHDAPYVIEGARACAQATGAKQILMAVPDAPELLHALKKLYPLSQMVTFPTHFPAGAEKLIIKGITGRMPAPNQRPHELGYLIHNTVSLRAIGRALIDGVPVLERPLSFIMPCIDFYRNAIIPLGHTAGKLIDFYKLPYDSKEHLIVESGLMMGHCMEPDDLIRKTTTSLLVINRDEVEAEERPCIRCGACNSSCPLGLHPFLLTEHIRKGRILGNSYQGQMEECFLCGVCAAVCPSRIPLLEKLRGGKECL